MMRLWSIAVFVVLSAIAALHLYWGFGGLWPAQDVRGLIDLVIGDTQAQAMPSAASTMVVAGLIFAGGVIALLRTTPLPFLPRLVVLSGCWVLAAVFLGRGSFTYLVAFGIAEWPYQLAAAFAAMDRTVYAPLCLGLGLSFVALALRGRG